MTTQQQIGQRVKVTLEQGGLHRVGAAAEEEGARYHYEPGGGYYTKFVEQPARYIDGTVTAFVFAICESGAFIEERSRIVVLCDDGRFRFCETDDVVVL